MRVLLVFFCLGLHPILCAMDTVRVQNVQQLFDSIQSDRLVLIEPGIYDFTNHHLLQTLDQSRVHKDLVLAPNVHYTSEEGVTVYKVKNIRFVGLGVSPSATIFVSSFLSDEVLTVLGCQQVQLENVQLTHNADAAGSIKGGLLKISQSTDVRVKNCELVGRASVGLTLWRSKDVYLNSAVVSTCSYGIADLRDSWTIRIEACQFKENKGCQHMWYMSGCTDVQISGCLFTDNVKRASSNCESCKMFSFVRSEMISMMNNILKGNACDYLGNSEAARVLGSTNDIKKNKFESLTSE